MKRYINLALALCMTVAMAMAQTTTNNNMDNNNTTGTVALMETSEGPVKILLYDDTPIHRDNFVKLAKEGYYDGVLFHRVIKDFMVQTGDPDSKNAKPGQQLGSGDPDYTLEAEFRYPTHFHKRGALAAARTGDEINPERRSSGSQFYIVTGTKWTDYQLDNMENRLVNSQYEDYFRSLVMQHMDEIKSMDAAGDMEGLEALQQQLIQQTESECKPVGIPAVVREVYKTEGGTPHLDGQYTVFGEVLEGMDVIDKIQNAPTNADDRPIEDIRVLKVTVQ